jgi:hypothetical protein
MKEKYDRNKIMDLIKDYVNALVNGDFSKVQFGPNGNFKRC